MMSDRLAQAEEKRAQAEGVRTMMAHIRALLEGRESRADVMAWTRSISPPDRGHDSPFRSGDALAVSDSICNLDARWGDQELIREIDLRAYLRWLGGGQTFHGDKETLLVVEGDIEVFAARAGTEAIRWWFDGIGWVVSVRFAEPARGRPFLGGAMLEQPRGLGITKLRSDGWNEAIVDLFEALAIDDADALYIDPRVDLGQVPVWVLYSTGDGGVRREIARFRSYAKAHAQAQSSASKTPGQKFWIEPA